MQGEVQEALYEIQLRSDDSFDSRLIRADQFSTGGVSHVNDQIAFHSIRNVNRGRSVTLHLYSLPIAQCNIYDTKTGMRGTKIMSNYTEFGSKVKVSSDD